jgi:hypothetical protein
MPLVNIDHVPTVSLPLFLIVSFARIYKTVTCDTSGRPCENSLQRRRVEGRQYLYENINTKVYMACLRI